jgi:dolichyl-diphosphooligosaccharide--protein glycosyltransferase
LNHLRGSGCREIWNSVVTALLIAWVIFLGVGEIIWGDFVKLALGGGFAATTLAVALSHILRFRGASKSAYFAGLSLISIGGISLLAALRPELVRSLVHNILTRTETGPSRTVTELLPLLWRGGRLSLWTAWNEFSTAWFVSLPALFFIARQSLRKNHPALTLFTSLSAVMLAASVLQFRMITYLAVNVAVLVGAAASWILAEQTGKRRLAAGLLLAATLFVPNVVLAANVARTDTGVPQVWLDSLAWLREHTPDPMGDATAFDRYYPRLAAGVAFSYPASAYGIMNWWDNGHWISAIGRRIPVSNPMQSGATEAAQFFIATEPERAAQILKQTGTRFIIVDSSLPMWQSDESSEWLGAFWAMPIWAAVPLSDYLEIYRSPGSGQAELVFYPAYYRSLLTRLYVFDGKAVQPQSSTWVIRYRQRQTSPVSRVREIVSSTPFTTYEEANRYIEAHPGESLVLGGLNPRWSCVPIEKLEGFRLAYPSAPYLPGASVGSDVKIFEYVGR